MFRGELLASGSAYDITWPPTKNGPVDTAVLGHPWVLFSWMREFQSTYNTYHLTPQREVYKWALVWLQLQVYDYISKCTLIDVYMIYIYDYICLCNLFIYTYPLNWICFFVVSAFQHHFPFTFLGKGRVLCLDSSFEGAPWNPTMAHELTEFVGVWLNGSFKHL